MKTAAERRVEIRRIDEDVTRIQARLEECFGLMFDIEARFKESRGDIFREIRKQTKRGQSTQLILKVRWRVHRVLRVPAAEWRRIEARGSRVARAQATIAGNGGASGAVGPRGHMAVFTRAIPMNRKHGWRIGDLRPYAHEAEIDFVDEAESALIPIRQRIATLTKTGTKMLQSRYQHAKALDKEATHGAKPAKKARKRKAPSWAIAENQLDLPLQPERSGDLFERPQLLNPDR